jgi:hypothetical protein
MPYTTNGLATLARHCYGPLSEAKLINLRPTEVVDLGLEWTLVTQNRNVKPIIS